MGVGMAKGGGEGASIGARLWREVSVLSVAWHWRLPLLLPGKDARQAAVDATRVSVRPRR